MSPYTWFILAVLVVVVLLAVGSVLELLGDRRAARS